MIYSTMYHFDGPVRILTTIPRESNAGQAVTKEHDGRSERQRDSDIIIVY
jgi:hypothetical protein